MLKQFGYHSDEMALAFAVWLCALPLVGFLIIPLFGLRAAGLVALTLLFVAVAVCWGVCSWKLPKGGKP